MSLELHFPCLTLSGIYTNNPELSPAAALTFWLLPSVINLHHLDTSHLCGTSELHSSQVAAGGNCSQHALRQTLRLLRGAATTRPVGLPGVSFMTVATTFKSSCRHTHTHTGRKTADMRSGTTGESSQGRTMLMI